MKFNIKPMVNNTRLTVKKYSPEILVFTGIAGMITSAVMACKATRKIDPVLEAHKKGAEEVHMRSSCPPLLYGCRFLNFSRSRNEQELAARRAIAELEGTDELTPEILKKYQVHGSKEYLAMVEIIRKKLNFTTLKYQELDRLLEAIGIPKENLCTYCWNGRDASLSEDNKEGK